ALTSFLLEAPSGYFLYRDFQSRNIMIYKGETWFIDYQGGRREPLQYDVASLLYDAKADLPDVIRKELLEFYLDALSSLIPVDRELFLRHYPGFILIRILQAMGTYGFRGYYEKKSHFLQSIPYALKNLSTIMDQPFLTSFPELKRVIGQMVEKYFVVKDAVAVAPGLHVLITSFSYKNGVPVDTTPHGGGFVFDCRALPNPGRYERFQQVTGKDQEVIDFLRKEPEMGMFLNDVYSLIERSVRIYLKRNFTHLMVSFGCTGGQHRSVYCAEALARYLAERYPVQIELHHREMENQAGTGLWEKR
ncbi:MAG: RNase adapter RapZ, partial [Bacteroidales bacterium]|nr:RNase adapter RapZ [Bacteroidales bacterium]